MLRGAPIFGHHEPQEVTFTVPQQAKRELTFDAHLKQTVRGATDNRSVLDRFEVGTHKVTILIRAEQKVVEGLVKALIGAGYENVTPVLAEEKDADQA